MRLTKNMNLKQRFVIEDKKRVDSILNEIRNNLLDYYLDLNTIVELHKKYQHNKIDSAQMIAVQLIKL